jgi:hypothetical protein
MGKELVLALVEPPLETLKQTRLLVSIVLFYVAKIGHLRNQHVFTLSIADNQDLVKMVGVFCQDIEIEQYSSLLERYSRSPKACGINIQIYAMLCKLLTMLVGYLVITFKFPKAEVSKCNLF